MRRGRPGKKRAGIVAGVLIAVFAAVLVSAYVVPEIVARKNTPVPAPSSTQGETAADGDGAAVSGDESMNTVTGPWTGQEEPAATYEVGVPFELVGEPDSEDGSSYDEVDGERIYNHMRDLPWEGTMRVTVSKPVLYDSLAAAGMDPGETAYYDEKYPGFGVVVVDIKIENVDATLKVDPLGNSFPINTRMFHIESSVSSYGLFADNVLISAPAYSIEGFEPERSRSYTWAEPGETIDVRMGFFVTHQEPVGGVADTYREVDDTVLDPYYILVITASEWRWGAPVVDLGRAAQAS